MLQVEEGERKSSFSKDNAISKNERSEQVLASNCTTTKDKLECHFNSGHIPLTRPVQEAAAGNDGVKHRL